MPSRRRGQIKRVYVRKRRRPYTRVDGRRRASTDVYAHYTRRATDADALGVNVP